MPQVTLKLFAELRRYADGKPSLEVEISAGTTILQLMARVGIPVRQTRLIFVNGRAASAERALQGGEEIEIFSAVGGG